MILEHCNRLSCVQMIEALTKERDEWSYGIRQYPPAVQDYKDLCAELKRVQFDLRVALAEMETEKQWRIEAQAQVALLREALAEASNEISDWGQYASEYFQDKYKLTEVVDRFAKIAAGG